MLPKIEQLFKNNKEFRKLQLETEDDIYVSFDGEIYNKTKDFYYKGSDYNGLKVISLTIKGWNPLFPYNTITKKYRKLGGAHRFSFAKLVAYMFVERPSQDHVMIWFKDRNRQNITMQNLEWITLKEKLERTRNQKNWNHSSPVLGDLKMAKKIHEAAIEMKKAKKIIIYKQLAKRFKVSEMLVYRLLNGLSYKARFKVNTDMVILSPDGFPFWPDKVAKSQKEINLQFKEIIERYKVQGYYRNNRNEKIPLQELRSNCSIIMLAD